MGTNVANLSSHAYFDTDDLISDLIDIRLKLQESDTGRLVFKCILCRDSVQSKPLLTKSRTERPVKGSKARRKRWKWIWRRTPDDMPAFRSAPSHGDAFMEDGVEGPKKKKRVSKTKAEPEEEDDDGVVDGGSSDLPQWLQKDSVLQKVIAKLGKVHKCFLSLDPQRNLDTTKSPVGRQLRGAMPVQTVASIVNSIVTSIVIVFKT